MKKIFRKFTLLLLLVPMLNSCELDPIDYSDINPSIFPQSKEDLEAMVLSCYYPLRGSWWDGINTTSERANVCERCLHRNSGGKVWRSEVLP